MRLTRSILLSVGWVGVIVGHASPDHTVATVAAGCAAAASITAGVSWLVKARRDNEEARRIRVETILKEQEYCSKCQATNGDACPLPEDARPATCPKKTKVIG